MIKAGSKTWLLGLLLGVVVAPVLANAHGQGLSRGEYERWHDVFAGSVSPDGKYFSYTLRYPGAQPKQATTEHVVVDIETGHEVVKVPGSVVPESSYSPDGRWYAMPGADGTRLLDLVSADTKVFQGHSRFGFAGQGKYFIVLERGSDPDAAAGKLSVVGLKGDAGFEMPEVGSFVISEDGETLGVVQRSAEAWVLKIIELGAQAGKGEVLLASTANLQLLAIGDERSYVLAQEAPGKDRQAVRPVTHYFERGDGGSVYRHYHHEHGSSGGEVSGVREHKWHASKQGAFILFSESLRHEQQVAAGTGDAELVASVQVWHSMDARVVTDRKRGSETRQIAWWPRSGSLVDVTSGGATIQLVTGDGRYALTRSGSLDIRTSYEDSSGRHELVDLATGSRTVLFQGGEGRAVQAISSSPCGRYLAYVADSKWWIHDIDGGSRQDVSDLVATPLLVEDWDMAGHVPPYGSPGWTVDNQLVIYDRYDAWLVSPDDKRARKITDGRATSRVYRVDHAANGVGLRAAVFDVSDGIVFSVVNEATKHSGYSIYRQDAGLTGLVYEDARIQRVLPRRGKGFVHMWQRFDTPPEIRVVDSLGKAGRTLFRSNTHHAELDRGRTKLIEYTGKSGKTLQGILLYPAGYDEDKSYPMIVSVYQRQSHLLHEYRMPSQSRYMPHANYTGDGYFVLLPDIEYGPGGPGDWALKSVTAAVEAALEVGRIDRHAIGLTGASWGGYQTLYIAGTSDLFATAIAGSAPSDLVSSYLSVESDLGIPASWRYEMQQLRMHAPLHEDYGSYVENSPIFRANGISIPILSWHGEKDGSIGLSQALEMHLLLRRMKRQHVLLVYPGEPHVIVDVEKAVDLNARMKQWFDHYLKGDVAADWIGRSYGQPKSELE